MTFVVLFVCTGNICRSPMAERLFAQRVSGDAGVVAVSAGTSGLTGWPMDAASERVLRELGGVGDGHEAQLLTGALIDQADLILTAEQAHREVVVRADRRAASRTFTLREFARLGAGGGALREPSEERLRERVAEVDRLRATTRPAGRRDDNIGDPYGAPLSQVRSCGRQIAEAVDGVVAALGLGPARAVG